MDEILLSRWRRSAEWVVVESPHLHNPIIAVASFRLAGCGYGCRDVPPFLVGYGQVNEGSGPSPGSSCPDPPSSQLLLQSDKLPHLARHQWAGSLRNKPSMQDSEVLVRSRPPLVPNPRATRKTPSPPIRRTPTKQEVAGAQKVTLIAS